MPLEQPDLHRLALRAAAHLSAFEETRPSHPADLTEDVRRHFVKDLKALHRRVYYPLQDRSVLHEKKAHRPAQLETPIVTENVDLNQLMFLLLERRTNLKGVLYQYYKRNDAYDARADFGIAMEPFLNETSPQEARSMAVNLLPKELDPTNDGAFMDFFERTTDDIHRRKLSGTRHSFLSQKIRARRNVIEYRNAAKSTIRAMGQHYERLRPGSSRALPEQIADDTRRTLAGLLLATRISELSPEGIERLSLSDVLSVYADEIALTLGARVSPVAGDDRLDCEFAPKTIDFVDVGNRYGDCTSRNREKQIDQIENIFWTIASYALDIFHQVLEVRLDGEPLIKAHIMPCLFHGRPTLHIDAIETILRLRDYVSVTKMQLNTNRDPALFERREEFLGALFDSVERIADLMGIELITCDSFSNTHWVQKSIHRFLPNVYHIGDFGQLYGGSFPKDLAEHILGTAVKTRQEIQAVNLSMTHPDLNLCYKRNFSLRGGFVKLRGI